MFRADLTTVAVLFRKLESEPESLSATIQLAVNRLACAYTALPSDEINHELQCMLEGHAGSTASEAVRTCVQVWALEIWPADDELHARILGGRDVPPLGVWMQDLGSF